MAMLNNQMIYIYIHRVPLGNRMTWTRWLLMANFRCAKRHLSIPWENWFMHWLVVWNMNFIFPYIGNFIIPTDFHIFQMGRYTTNQIMVLIHCGFPKIEKHKHVRPEARNHQVSSPTKNNACLLTNWLMRNHQLNNQSWFQKSPEMMNNPSTTNQTWTIKSNKGLLR